VCACKFLKMLLSVSLFIYLFMTACIGPTAVVLVCLLSYSIVCILLYNAAVTAKKTAYYMLHTVCRRQTLMIAIDRDRPVDV